MSGFSQSIINRYNYLFHELHNPVTKNWFLAGKPYQIASILIVYLIFATRLGPWYMRNKRPYDLRTVIKYYNLFQIVASLYLCYQGAVYIFAKDFSYLCQNLDDPTTPRAYEVAVAGWQYFIIKVIDLLDTVFFVLRKSDRQITSLHLHHHTLMPLASWIGVTYFPGGQAAIMACLNTFVHAVMYTYYYLASLGEDYQKYLWWKKHVTQLQLTQFIIVGVHAFNSMFYDCGYPTWIKIGMIMYAGVFINMFGQFYYNAYIVKKPRTNGKAPKDESATEKHTNGPEVTDQINRVQNEKESNGTSDASKAYLRNGIDPKTTLSNGLKKNI